jgi:hypothetical protein
LGKVSGVLVVSCLLCLPFHLLIFEMAALAKVPSAFVGQTVQLKARAQAKSPARVTLCVRAEAEVIYHRT